MQIKMLICNQNSWTTNTNFYGFLLWFVSHPQKIGLYRNTSRYCSVTISCSPTIFANLSYCHFPQTEWHGSNDLSSTHVVLLSGGATIGRWILISLPGAYCVTPYQLKQSVLSALSCQLGNNLYDQRNERILYHPSFMANNIIYAN